MEIIVEKVCETIAETINEYDYRQMTSQMGAKTVVIIVMGVSGSGKTTVGTLLAESLGWAFQDADSFHSPKNVRKMSQGLPLTDSDRAPWLAELSRLLQHWVAVAQPTVLACSALKNSYRETLADGLGDQCKFVYLRGSDELILHRLQERGDHFMKADMLDSQLTALEEPVASRGTVVVDAALQPDEIVQEIRKQLLP